MSYSFFAIVLIDCSIAGLIDCMWHEPYFFLKVVIMWTHQTDGWQKACSYRKSLVCQCYKAWGAALIHHSIFNVTSDFTPSWLCWCHDPLIRLVIGQCSFLSFLPALWRGSARVQLLHSRERRPHCGPETVSGHMGGTQAALASADWANDGCCQGTFLFRVRWGLAFHGKWVPAPCGWAPNTDDVMWPHIWLDSACLETPPPYKAAHEHPRGKAPLNQCNTMKMMAGKSQAEESIPPFWSWMEWDGPSVRD